MPSETKNTKGSVFDEVEPLPTETILALMSLKMFSICVPPAPIGNVGCASFFL